MEQQEQQEQQSMSNVKRRSVVPSLVLALAAACHDGAATSAPAEPPSIRFLPQVVSFPTGANGAGLTTAVEATVTGLGPSPTLRWESRAPDAVAIDSVTRNGTGVWLRGIWPRGTYIVVTATGTTTLVDSLTVAILAGAPPVAPAVARDSAAWFQTDSLHYALRANAMWYETTIGVRFTNRSARPASFVNCNGSTGLSLEKLVDGQWQAVWTPPIPACLSQPITVPAGASYRTELHMLGGLPDANVTPRFTTRDLTGVVRLVWHDVVYDYQPQLPWGNPLPAEARVSNRFALTSPTGS